MREGRRGSLIRRPFPAFCAESAKCPALAWWLALVLGCAALGADAAEDDAGLWFTLTLATPLTSDVDFTLALQPRVDSDIGRLERVVVRPSVDWQAGKRLRLSQGYDAHVLTPGEDRIEHRLWQQAQWTETLHGALTGMLRFRLEERFVERVRGAALRGRWLAGARYALDGSWALNGSNELFVNFNQPTGTPDAAFDQNRTLVGVSRRFGVSAEAFLGYQLQYVNAAAGDRRNHQIFLSWSERF